MDDVPMGPDGPGSDPGSDPGFLPPWLPPDTHYPFATSDQFHDLPSSTRHFFYWVILAISVFAIIGNVLAIRSIIERKTKFLQKSCIFALATSDLITVTLFTINMLDMLSKEQIEWSLGEFMCYFIPFGQVFSTTTSSLLLTIIAMDRYQNVIQTFSKSKWNPKPIKCIISIILLFLICAVISYPMYTLFTYQPFWVIMMPITESPTYQLRVLCIVATKSKVKNYYVALDALIFLPMLTVFIWFYVKVAALIWKHRKPVTSKFNKFDSKELEDSTSSTKITNISSNNTVLNENKPKKEKNLQAERKIRTFRIVLVLIVSFVVCRFPYWCFYTLRLLELKNSNTSWNLHFSLVSLNLFNCVLNPLLYTFLNQTVTAIRVIRDFFWKICCCCCSSDEFEEFERENPFARDQVRPACGPVKPKIKVDKDYLQGRKEKSTQKY